MVPVINFHEYKRFLKRAIIRRLDQVIVDECPNDYAWLAYSLSADGKEDNLLYTETFDNLSKWVSVNANNIPTKYLPALGVFLYLQPEGSDDLERIQYLETRLIEVMRPGTDRFSPINDPFFILPISMGLKNSLSEPHRTLTIEICQKNGKSGKLFRRALFLACVEELDSKRQVPFEKEVIFPNIEDVITIIWYNERYNKKNIEAPRMWAIFENLRELITTEESSELGMKTHYLSNANLALLYEAVTNQTITPDPQILFNTYQIHGRIRQVSRSLFVKGEYFASVFEATKVLDTVVKEMTGIENTGRPLMQEAMRPKDPQIKFNRLETQTEKNEQEGLRAIAEGIMAAFRNPKGHEPKDTTWGDINPYDALDQLITISYIMKRIENAKIEKKTKENVL